jgi:Fe2+ or Zn2+ uptake regulation protein
MTARAGSSGARHPRWLAPPLEAVRRRVQARGGRLTRQREIVYEYLRTVSHHPTAEEVYFAVKRKLPRVSLATIYKGLDSLVANGVASKFPYGNGAARYDIRTDEHAHTRCLECGRLADLDVLPDTAWVAAIRVPGFRVAGFRFELVGRCKRCQPL